MARILVADDNAALANVVRFHLSRVGHDVVVVSNGQAALDAILQSRSQSPFDALVTDEQMPQRTGLELCETLRNEHPEISLPIVLLTAKRLELDVENVKREHGISEIFPKPFSPSELLSVVQGLLATVESEL